MLSVCNPTVTDPFDPMSLNITNKALHPCQAALVTCTHKSLFLWRTPGPPYSCSKACFPTHTGDLPSPWPPQGLLDCWDLQSLLTHLHVQFFLAREVLFPLQSFIHPQIPQTWDSMSPSLLPPTLMPVRTWIHRLALPHSWHQTS